jgi:putative spermidine/putrescine transport system permease protein
MKSRPVFAWFFLLLAAVYLLVPLYATFQFSLQGKRGELGFTAYNNVLVAPEFTASFGFSIQTALLTILLSLVLIVPTAYWVNLRVPRARPIVEFFTLIPFVVPTVIVAFGLLRSYNTVRFGDSRLTDSTQGIYLLMLGAYVSLTFPYMYRAVDTGLQAVNIRALTEAAQSLGAGWFTILMQVIVPNIITSVLSGAFIAFAIVMGEFTIASALNQPTFGPYMNAIAGRKVFEPSALAIISFGLTWLCIAVVQFLGRGRGGSITGLR